MPAGPTSPYDRLTMVQMAHAGLLHLDLYSISEKLNTVHSKSGYYFLSLV